MEERKDEHEIVENPVEEIINQDDILGEEVINEHGEYMDEDLEPEAGEDAEHEEGENQVIFEDDSVQGFFLHKEPVYSVSINPKYPDLVVSGGGDDKGYLWNKATGDLVYPMEGHTDSVTSVGFSSDGTYISTAGMDGRLCVYKIEENLEVKPHCLFDENVGNEVQWTQWHQSGNIIAAGYSDSTIWLINAVHGSTLNVLSGIQSDTDLVTSTTCGRFSNSGRTLVAGYSDGAVRVWGPSTQTVVQKFLPNDKRNHQDSITSIDISSDDQLIMTGSEDSTAKIFHASRGTVVATYQQNDGESVECVGLQQNLAAAGTSDGQLCVYDINTSRLRSRFLHEEAAAVTKLKWIDSHLIVSSSADGTVRVWDARSSDSKHAVREFKGHDDTVLDFDISPDGQHVVSGGDDGCCLVFML
ncbi:putative WD repeat-containing protein [Zancudomyces culisetae]|uniref:Putative WD repeat-containing protein n=1 Tax=Zancudomyces culisetae TaxID=1213189 RepID=A0A1R1PNR5_ZANCU|nr:putative WD repeat-containing protein [Zancudomyces culisetae]|eukprot:OMH82609.1 putative WD repeat-containing protein [Zancudomyces culisetae]